MNFLNKIFKFYLIYEIIGSISCDNNSNINSLTSDEIEKRRSVKQFFDSIVAGTNQNTKTSSPPLLPSTPRPVGPIYMPFAVPVHSHGGPPGGPHVHMPPPHSFGYSSNINNIFRPAPPPPLPQGFGPQSRPHVHMSPPMNNFGPAHHYHSHHSHDHGHHNHGPLPPVNQNFGSQSHSFPTSNIPNSAFNHFDMRQHSRPIAIAIPLPLHAIPLHLISNTDDNSKFNSFSPNTDFTDDMKASTKYSLFADPFEDVVDEDLFDNQRFKFVPIPNKLN